MFNPSDFDADELAKIVEKLSSYATDTAKLHE
jgi:hypothetical protein